MYCKLFKPLIRTASIILTGRYINEGTSVLNSNKKYSFNKND